MRELKVLTGKRVVIVTPDTALDGIVESCTGDAVTLIKVTEMGGQSPFEVEGLVIVPVSRISYVRVP